MTHAEALELLRDGIAPVGGSWADLGAGGGTFTRALAEQLGPAGTVYALDRNPAVVALDAPASRGSARIVARRADFTRSFTLPPLDGILMANSLHFVRRKEHTLRTLLPTLRTGGRFLLIEYDLERGNPWVPFPLSWRAWQRLAPTVGLGPPRQLGRRRSRYGHRDLVASLAFKATPEGSGHEADVRSPR